MYVCEKAKKKRKDRMRKSFSGQNVPYKFTKGRTVVELVFQVYKPHLKVSQNEGNFDRKSKKGSIGREKY